METPNSAHGGRRDLAEQRRCCSDADELGHHSSCCPGPMDHGPCPCPVWEGGFLTCIAGKQEESCTSSSICYGRAALCESRGSSLQVEHSNRGASE